jgi:hypothetical protein
METLNATCRFPAVSVRVGPLLNTGASDKLKEKATKIIDIIE